MVCLGPSMLEHEKNSIREEFDRRFPVKKQPLFWCGDLRTHYEVIGIQNVCPHAFLPVDAKISKNMTTKDPIEGIWTTRHFRWNFFNIRSVTFSNFPKKMRCTMVGRCGRGWVEVGGLFPGFCFCYIACFWHDARSLCNAWPDHRWSFQKFTARHPFFSARKMCHSCRTNLLRSVDFRLLLTSPTHCNNKAWNLYDNFWIFGSIIFEFLTSSHIVL